MDDLCTAPGKDDFTFGSLLTEMIGMAFNRIDDRRFIAECRLCHGNDAERPIGQRSQIALVKHRPGCSMERHLPRLHAMANKDVT